MRTRCFPGFQGAYVAALRHIHQHGRWVAGVHDPTSIGSHFGAKVRATREVMPLSFTIENPRDRLLFLRQRRVDIGFLLANVLWTLSGEQSLDRISAYNSRGKAFAPDGRQLETAFGVRLFGPPGGSHFDAAIRRLREDGTTRRAVIALYENQDLLSSPRDTPCAISVQYAVREGRLEASTFMRSQSVAMVLPYDIAIFTFLQELAAQALGLPLGPYHHVCFSAHYYEDEARLVEAVLAEDAPPAVAMDALPEGTSGDLGAILSAEKELRCSAGLGVAGLQDVAGRFHPYWKNVLLTMRRSLDLRLGPRNDRLSSLIQPPFSLLYAE